MKLARAKLLSVRGLPDLTWDLSRAGAPADVAIVTGAPASGKTRLLEAIIAAKEVIAAYGPPLDGSEWVRPGDSAAKVELTWSLDPDEQRRAGGAPATVHSEAIFRRSANAAEVDDAVLDLLERYEHNPAHGKIDYLPANRALPQPGAMHGLSAVEQRLYRLGAEPRKYSFVPRFLFELDAEPGRRARFLAALEALSPSLRYIEPEADDPLRCLTSRGGPPLRPSEISTTEADALLMAATAALVRWDRSILLIDRPEVSAGERQIVAWLGALRSVAPSAQIILAGASPALLAGAEAGSVLNLDNL